MIDVNFTGAANVARLAWRHMRKPDGGAGGSIVFVSSIASGMGRQHARYVPVYSPTKAALDQLTRSLALPAAAEGVRVYCCNPGVTDTDMGRGVRQSQFPHDTLEDFAVHYNPDRVPASAADVGGAIVRLLRGEVAEAAPGDCLACFAGGVLRNMSAIYARMAFDDADAVGVWRE